MSTIPVTEYGESLINLNAEELELLIAQTDINIAGYERREQSQGQLTQREYVTWDRLLRNQAKHMQVQCAHTLTLLLLSMLRNDMMGAYWNAKARKV